MMFSFAVLPLLVLFLLSAAVIATADRTYQDWTNPLASHHTLSRSDTLSSPVLRLVSDHWLQTPLSSSFSGSFGHTLTIRIALKHSNTNQLNDKFRTVSDPTHPEWRQFLTVSEISSLLSPPESFRSSLESFVRTTLMSSSTNEQSLEWSPWGDFLTFEADIDRYKKYFNTDIHEYRYLPRGHLTSATELQSALDQPAILISWKTSDELLQSFPSEFRQQLSHFSRGVEFPLRPNRLRPSLELLSKPTQSLESASAAVSAQSSDNDNVIFQGRDGVWDILISVTCPDGSHPFSEPTCYGLSLSSLTAYYRPATAFRSIATPDAPADWTASVCTYRLGYIQVGYSSRLVAECPVSTPINIPMQFKFEFLWGSSSIGRIQPTYTPILTRNAYPLFLSQLYGINGTVVPTSIRHGVASLRLNSPLLGYFSPQDASLFNKRNGLPASTLNFIDYSGKSNDGSRPDPETSLDVQTMSGIGPGVELIVAHGGDLDEPMIVVQNLAKDGKHPNVLSFSYGEPESQSLSVKQAHFDVLFQALGLLGISVFASSGDNGAFRNLLGSCWTDLAPTYPASSPFVTAVGGTQLLQSSNTNADTNMEFEEIVCSLQTGAGITSGGGFSGRYEAPWWQTNALKHYVSNPKFFNPGNMANTSKRAYPDISALSHQYEIFFGSNLITEDGTSASSPLIAGLFNLINDALLQRGDAPLGFLNPLLYHLWSNDPSHYRDVQFGDNGCQEQSCCSMSGFIATEGYDAASGLGTPRMDRIATTLNITFHTVQFPRDLRISNNNNNDDDTSLVIKVVVIVVSVSLFIFMVLGVYHLYKKCCQQRLNNRNRAQMPLDQREPFLPSPAYYSIQVPSS